MIIKKMKMRNYNVTLKFNGKKLERCVSFKFRWVHLEENLTLIRPGFWARETRRMHPLLTLEVHQVGT